MSHTIFPCLWFDGKAKAAAGFYCSIFSHSKITVDTPMVVQFEIEGQKLMGLNGGPMFKITPAISLFVTCTSSEEIDTLWAKLSEGGKAMMPLDTYPWSKKYGWVADQFGMTWQLMLSELPPGGQKIIPSMLFVGEQYGKAERAIRKYASIFPNSVVHELQLYQEGEPQPAGNLKFGHFTLNGSLFAAMDGPGDHNFAFNEGVSLLVECDAQAEIDDCWNKLIEGGGQESRCGWLKDRYGVSWQIVPKIIGSLMSDPEKAARLMPVVMTMTKLDIQALLDA
jgi:predicted 3-demethylubiquinone-9 3-methyltransferase (glyoxalase superfamily)